MSTHNIKSLRTGLIFAIILLLTLDPAFGQKTSSIDSIRHVAETSQDREVQVRNYLKIAQIHIKRSNADSILHYTNLADRLLKDIPKALHFYHRVYAGKMWAYRIKGDYQKATEYGFKLDEELTRIVDLIDQGVYKTSSVSSDTVYLNEHYNALSELYRPMGDYEKAYYYVIKALDYATSIDHQFGIADSYNNLGIIYDLQGNPEEAATHYGKAIKINLELGKSRRWQLGTNYNNLGIILKDQGKYDSAALVYQGALEIMKDMNQRYGEGVILDNLGTLLKVKGDFEQAAAYHLEALDMMKSLGSKDQESAISINLSDDYLSLGRGQEALQLANTAYQIAVEDDQWENVRKGSQMLSEIHESLGDHEKSLQFYKTFHKEYERYQNEEKNNAVENLRVRYETQQQINENELLKTEVLVNESLIERQQLYIVIAAVILIFVLVILFILYRGYKSKIRQKAIIEKQANQLQELDKYKSRFFANVAHDLRTPLTLIHGRLEQLSEDEDNYLTDKSKGFIENLKQYNRHLSSLVEDMRQLMVMESGQLVLSYERVNLTGYFGTIVSLFQSYADLKQIKLEFKSTIDDSVVAHLDLNQMNKVVYNLLNNALKFTPSNGQVICKLESSTDAFCFLISDTGIGIPNNVQTKVFDRYFQASNQPQSREGLGIGLSLVKEIVEMHEGSVSVKSQEGVGSEFQVCLPFNLTKSVGPESAQDLTYLLDRADTLVAQEQLQGSVAFGSAILSDKPTILVVDDHHDVRTYLTEILESDFRVLQTSNGKEALDVLDKRRVDLVITDLMMPFMDGFGLLDALSSNPRFARLPTMVVSARVSDHDKNMVLSKGVNDFLSKPFAKSELIARIQNLLVKQEHSPFGNQEAEKHVRTSALDKLDNYLLQNITRQISVEELAAELLTSERNLYRMIKSLTDKTPLEYQKDIKYQYVYKMVTSNQVSTIKEAAALIGVKNTTYFKAQFTERYGEDVLRMIQ
ncbi:MAG: tetratricopeptide repeat protein [Marinoscillum sp.]